MFTSLQLLHTGAVSSSETHGATTEHADESHTRCERLERRAKPSLGRFSPPPRSRFYCLLHPVPANSHFPAITWQKNSVERERGRKELAQFCLNVYQNQAEKLAVCLALAAKHKVTQRQLQPETAGNRASVGVLPRHPSTYFAGGSRDQREQHWTLPRHAHPALGTPASFGIASRPSVPYLSAHHGAPRALTRLKHGRQQGPAGEGILCESRSHVNLILEC